MILKAAATRVAILICNLIECADTPEILTVYSYIYVDVTCTCIYYSWLVFSYSDTCIVELLAMLKS